MSKDPSKEYSSWLLKRFPSTFVLNELMQRTGGWQRVLQLASDVVLKKNIAALVPAEPFGVGLDRFRVKSQALLSWKDKQLQRWSFSGTLAGTSDRLFGFHLEFAERHTQEDRLGVMPAHWVLPRYLSARFSLTDSWNARSSRAFRFWQRGGLAGRGVEGFAASDRFHVEVGGWHAFAEETAEGPLFRVFANGGAQSLHLELVPEGPLAYFGQSGYFQKGASSEDSSFWCAYPRLKAKGQLLLEGRLHPVSGTCWLDHQKSTGAAVGAEETLRLQLSTGEDLLLFSSSAVTSAEWRAPTGENKHFVAAEIVSENLEYWTSPETGVRYPVRRKISILPLGLVLEVRPTLNAQEVNAVRTATETYWCGTVRAAGERSGEPVSAEGEMELRGYDKRRWVRAFEKLNFGI